MLQTEQPNLSLPTLGGGYKKTTEKYIYAHAKHSGKSLAYNMYLGMYAYTHVCMRGKPIIGNKISQYF